MAIHFKFIFADAEFCGDLHNRFNVGLSNSISEGTAYKLTCRFEFHGGFRWCDFLSTLWAFFALRQDVAFGFCLDGFLSGLALVIESPC
jgi:hypothetical protein